MAFRAVHPGNPSRRTRGGDGRPAAPGTAAMTAEPELTIALRFADEAEALNVLGLEIAE